MRCDRPEVAQTLIVTSAMVTGDVALAGMMEMMSFPSSRESGTEMLTVFSGSVSSKSTCGHRKNKVPQCKV